MRKIMMSALFAIGVGLAASAPASAAPMTSLGEAGASNLLQNAQVIVVEPRRRYYRPRVRCYNKRVCFRTYGGRLRCHYERVCRRW